MRYVVTFEHPCGEHESYTVSSSCVEVAIMDAKEKANENHNHTGYNFYSDIDILSVIRV